VESDTLVLKLPIYQASPSAPSAACPVHGRPTPKVWTPSPTEYFNQKRRPCSPDGSETPLAGWDQSCEAAGMSGPGRVRGHGLMVSRFVEACSADDRIVAAFLYGSRATGEADEYSDLDLGVITKDDALENVMAERAAFARQLGQPVFMEDFGHDRIAFFILADGTECEVVIGREGELEELDVGPFVTLVDKRGILDVAEFPLARPDPDERREELRQVLNWFWHDLSHFVAALGRGELWWACGQLEALRRYCVNLLRIEHGVEAQEEAYEKLEKAVPVSELAALRPTFCPMERDAMLKAALDVVRFFREHAPRVA
jgi:predicted nucleotidyltransferase